MGLGAWCAKHLKTIIGVQLFMFRQFPIEPVILLKEKMPSKFLVYLALSHTLQYHYVCNLIICGMVMASYCSKLIKVELGHIKVAMCWDAEGWHEHKLYRLLSCALRSSERSDNCCNIGRCNQRDIINRGKFGCSQLSAPFGYLIRWGSCSTLLEEESIIVLVVIQDESQCWMDPAG